MIILLIGNGGREHAMAWKIAQSPKCTKLYIAPGNPGTAMYGENVAISTKDFKGLADFAVAHSIDMVVAGPEEPLVRGLADYFAEGEHTKNVLFVGPGADGARLEGSKAFAKAFMKRHQIPTASYRSFTLETLDQGRKYLQESAAPYVIKADGLAAGKGVVICHALSEATGVLEEMLESQLFGQASATVVIEDFLKGVELSVFAITDGTSYKLLPAAKDYKRVGEDDTGPNTGGMGAVSPVPFADRQFMEKVEARIVRPTIKGLQEEGIAYCGFIFFGLIHVEGDPYVIEYNVRLGDPETQAILPRLEGDFVALLEAAARGNLAGQSVQISPKHAATVVVTSGGYPGNYETGFPVENLHKLTRSQVFMAGVEARDGRLLTSGGRVLAATSLADSLPEACKKAYDDVAAIDFRGMYYRRDIGKDVMS